MSTELLTRAQVQKFVVGERPSAISSVAPLYVVEEAATRRRARDSIGYRTRQAAESRADDMNILALIKPYEEDPRSWEVRFAEAEQTYREACRRG